MSDRPTDLSAPGTPMTMRRIERNLGDAYRTLTRVWWEKLAGREWVFRAVVQRPRLFRRHR